MTRTIIVSVAGPVETVEQNLNGRPEICKIYELATGENPSSLKEELFVSGGYLYTYQEMTQIETTEQDKSTQKQSVTVSTGKNDWSVVLAKLAPSIE